MKPTDKQILIKMPPELRLKIKREAAKRGIYQKDLIIAYLLFGLANNHRIAINPERKP